MDELVTVWALLVHNAVRIRFHFRSGQDKLVLRLLQLQRIWHGVKLRAPYLGIAQSGLEPHAVAQQQALDQRGVSRIAGYFGQDVEVQTTRSSPALLERLAITSGFGSELPGERVAQGGDVPVACKCIRQRKRKTRKEREKERLTFRAALAASLGPRGCSSSKPFVVRSSPASQLSSPRAASDSRGTPRASASAPRRGRPSRGLLPRARPSARLS